MIRKIAFLFSFSTITLIQCKNQEIINVNTIDRIFREDPNLPSQFFNYFFCKCQDQRIVMLDIYNLREIYKKSYSDIEYKTFLKDILNQRLLVECHSSDYIFDIDSGIKEQYENLGRNKFLELYCKEFSKNRYHLNKDIPEKQNKTVMYILYINGFMIYQDDYLGTYLIKK